VDIQYARLHLPEVETTENNIIIAGNPRQIEGASGPRYGAGAFSANGFHKPGRGAR
jgi:hypothetical protein